MAKINLSDGQDLVLLDYQNDSWMKVGAPTVGTSFSYHSLHISPAVDECESDGAQQVEYQTNDNITDNLGNVYNKIVGGRPRVKPRS